MGLYINSNHRTIYKTDKHPVEPNQGFFIKNHTAEMVEEQKRVNEQLNKSFSELKRLYEVQESENLSKWTEMIQQVVELRKIHQQHEALENDVLQKLHLLKEGHHELHKDIGERRKGEKELKSELTRILTTQQSIDKKVNQFDEMNRQLKENHEKLYQESEERRGVEKELKLELHRLLTTQQSIDNKMNQFGGMNEQLQENYKKLHHEAGERRIVEQDFKSELHRLVSTQHSIEEKMATFHEVNQQLYEKLNQQLEVEKKLHDKFEKQETSQEEVKSRLENQEALTEKVTRQIDHFRSALYERTNYLSEKIDKVSSYVTNLYEPINRTRYIVRRNKTNK